MRRGISFIRLFSLPCLLAVATLSVARPAVAAGTNATVGDANASQGMANDPSGAITSMDKSSNGETGRQLTTTVPDLGPYRDAGAGASRTGGTPMGTSR